ITGCARCSRASARRWWRTACMRPASSSGTGSPSLGCVPPWSARCGKRWRWPVPRSTEEMKSPVSATTSRPIAIYYEHPDWFRPLFQELDRRGVPYPRARVINHPARAPEAAQGFRFPVIVKPNIGGSGAGIRRFETPQQLEQAAGAGALDLGIDQTALVQEYIPAAEQRIVRVE